MAGNCDLLLTDGLIVTMDDQRRLIDQGAVAVTGDRIAAVGEATDLQGYKADRTVDCSGKAVIPGLIDCHNHLFQSLGRGLGEGMSLWTWLHEFMWRYSAAITPEQARAAVTLGAIEAARAGATTIVDNHNAPTDLDTTLAVAAAIEEVGLRGIVARGIVGEPTEMTARGGFPTSRFRFSNEEELDITRAAIEARPPGSRVGVWPAPISITHVSQDLVRWSVALARELGTGWHTHCSETKTDPEAYLEAYGIRPIEWLYREGLLGPGSTVAHAIWLDDSEVGRLGQTSTGISHNPISNQYLASGVFRLRDLRQAGAVIGLGSDGPSCGHRQDLFECMKGSILLQRAHKLEPTESWAEEALELATRDGAKCVGIDAGQLAPGRLADMVVLELSRPHLTPLHRVVSSLVYAARGSDVVMTIVGGDVVYEDGRCTRIVEEDAMDEAQRRADELTEKAGIARLTHPWILRSDPL